MVYCFLVTLWECRGSLLMLRTYVAIQGWICTVCSSPILLVHVNIVEVCFLVYLWSKLLLFHSVLGSFHFPCLKPLLYHEALILQTAFDNFLSNTLLFLKFLNVFWVLCFFRKLETNTFSFHKSNLYQIGLFLVSDILPYTSISIDHVFMLSY